MRALQQKALRDLGRMRTQFLAITLVLACGVGLFSGTRTTMRSLAAAQASWYAQARFADVFASVERAPETVAERLRAIDGVQQLQTRVVAPVTLDLPGVHEAIVGRLVSLPDRGRPVVCDLRLRSGRWPLPGHGEEVLANEAFVQAHGLVPGAELAVVIKGRRERLRIVGTALSPEYTYALGPGLLFPDDRRFGVLWMPRRVLGPAFEMEGAFNDVVLRLAPGVPAQAVIEAVDRTLERFGGVGAFARRDQPSHFFLENELVQLRAFTLLMPALFLAVAAFLLQIVIGRIIASQREQIATLKAVGYRDRELGWHYAQIVGLVVAVGTTLGVALGAWLGATMTRMYSRYYRFPELPHELDASDVAIALAVAVVAAAAGTVIAIARAVRLQPAEAMRPPTPATYRRALVERLGIARYVPLAVRMILRELERRPARAALSVLGVAFAIALVVVGAFGHDSVRRLLNVELGLMQRAEVTLLLSRPRSLGALAELRALPGVVHAEPFRIVPVRMRSGSRERTTSVTGIPAAARLHSVLDVELRDLEMPRDGLVLSSKLAEALGVAQGDEIEVEVREGARAVHRMQIARVAETFVGLQAFMNLHALARVLRESASLSGAWLAVSGDRVPRLHAIVKRTPQIAGITERKTTLVRIQRVLDENLGTMLAVTVGFSLVMSFGVLYNTARIMVAERARDLMSLRVLGFRRREVGAILVGELATLVTIAVVPGLALGRWLAGLLASSSGFDNEQFRLPLTIAPATYATAVVAVLGAAAASAWTGWRRLDRLDLVDVLKARD